MAGSKRPLQQGQVNAQASSETSVSESNLGQAGTMGTSQSSESKVISQTFVVKPSKKATISEMKADLAQQGLDTKGKKETLWRYAVTFPSSGYSTDMIVRRLMNAFTALTIGQPSAQPEDVAEEEPEPEVCPWEGQKWESLLCFDVEATCRGGREFDWPNEIIVSTSACIMRS
jgi:3'-5' exoribonuclease 1